MIITHPPLFFARTLPAGVVLALIVGLSLTRETRAQPPAVTTDPEVTTTAPNGWWKNGRNHEAYVGRDVRSTNTQMTPRKSTISGPIRERKWPDAPVNLRLN